MKLAIIFNQDKLSGKLTRFFTGCYAYHTAWVDEDAGKMYDMHWIRRRRLWPHYDPGEYLLYDFPMVTREYLEHELDVDESWYGAPDYTLFAWRWFKDRARFVLRPLYHLFGQSTKNANGVICSEMINIDVINCGGDTPWALDEAPPSPCDWYQYLKGLEIDNDFSEAAADPAWLYSSRSADLVGSNRAADHVSPAESEEITSR